MLSVFITLSGVVFVTSTPITVDKVETTGKNDHYVPTIEELKVTQMISISLLLYIMILAVYFHFGAILMTS